jgi:hypothetical protein
MSSENKVIRHETQISKKISSIQNINETIKDNTPSLESYEKMLTYVNKSIDALNKIDISKLPKPKVSDAWGLQSQNDQHDQHRTPPTPTDYAFMEGSAPYEAGTIIVKNFIWLTEDSKKGFTQDEKIKTIKKLSTLKKLYLLLKTFLEEQIEELEKSKEVEVAAESVETPEAKTLTEDAIHKATNPKIGGRKRRTKRSTKRSSKRKHRKSMSKRR